MTLRTIVLLYLLPQQVRMLKTGRAGDDDNVAAAATGLDKSSPLGKEHGRVGSWGAHRVSAVGPNGPIGKTWAFFRPGQVRTGLGRAEKTRLFRVEKILPMPGLGQVTCACPSHSAHLIFFLRLQDLCPHLSSKVRGWVEKCSHGCAGGAACQRQRVDPWASLSTCL
jgi:hypothetical protein